MEVSEAYKELVIKMEKFKAVLEITFNNESISTDLEGKCTRKLMYFSEKILRQRPYS
jgi:hypothetical protein